MCAQLVSTTPLLNTFNLKGKDLGSSEFREFTIALTQFLGNLADATNDKESGEYSTVETVNGQKFWSLIPGEDQRAVNRLVIDFGALPDGTASITKTIAHGISFPAGSIWTKYTGTATNTTTGAGVCLPYSSPTLANNIEIAPDATNITVTVDTTVDWSAYDTTYIYLEWI